MHNVSNGKFNHSQSIETASFLEEGLIDSVSASGRCVQRSTPFFPSRTQRQYDKQFHWGHPYSTTTKLKSIYIYIYSTGPAILLKKDPLADLICIALDLLLFSSQALLQAMSSRTALHARISPTAWKSFEKPLLQPTSTP